MQGIAHGFPHQFETVKRADGRQNMGRVGALFPPRFEQVALLEERQQSLQKQGFSLSLDSSRWTWTPCWSSTPLIVWSGTARSNASIVKA